MKVLYVAGHGRCGSTLLGMLLGQQRDFVYVGEIMNLWAQWDTEGALCSCGEGLQNCEFWSRLMISCCANVDHAERVRLFDVQSAACRSVRIPLWAIDTWKRRQMHLHSGYFSRLASLYRAIFEDTGASVIVDTSKVPTYGVFLKSIPDVSVYVLHMIRDPRAIAHSWMRTMQRHPGGIAS